MPRAVVELACVRCPACSAVLIELSPGPAGRRRLEFARAVVVVLEAVEVLCKACGHRFRWPAPEGVRHA